MTKELEELESIPIKRSGIRFYEELFQEPLNESELFQGPHSDELQEAFAILFPGVAEETQETQSEGSTVDTEPSVK
jgi:hypothetical protein